MMEGKEKSRREKKERGLEDMEDSGLSGHRVPETDMFHFSLQRREDEGGGVGRGGRRRMRKGKRLWCHSVSSPHSGPCV
jgi:hypothetical protein